MEQLVESHWIDPADRRLFVDQAFADHFHRHAQSRLGSALAAAGLQHPQRALLHGEFDVLHVAVVVFEQVEDTRQLAIGIGHRLFHRQRLGIDSLACGLGEVLRRADAGHDILALRIDQVFAVIGAFAGRGIAGEGNAGRAGIAHVPEHHRLYIDGSTPVGGNVVQAAIDLCAVRIPAVEHGADRAPELFRHILRERLAEFIRHDLLVFRDQRLPVARFHLGVGVVALVFLGDLERFFEQSVIEAENDVGIHLDEAAVAVPGEAFVTRSAGKARNGFVIEAEIEDGVHHPRHRNPRARTDRNEQRVRRIAKALADGLFDMGQRLGNLGAQIGGEVRAILQIAHAFFGRDGEARRHGQADARHFGKVRALAARDGLVLLTRIRVIGVSAEGVDCLHARGILPIPTRWNTWNSVQGLNSHPSIREKSATLCTAARNCASRSRRYARLFSSSAFTVTSSKKLSIGARSEARADIAPAKSSAAIAASALGPATASASISAFSAGSGV